MDWTESTFVRAQDLSSLGILLDVLDDIDEVGDLREERIVISESDGLLAVIAWLADIEHGLDIRVYKPDREDQMCATHDTGTRNGAYFRLYPSAYTSSSQL